MLSVVQPLLKVQQTDTGVSIQGHFLVHINPNEVNPEGPLDRYQVRIEIDRRFPKVEPIVFETGDRLPRAPERHVNDDGSCCLCVWEAWRVKTLNPTIVDFVNGPVHQYFLSQTHYEETGEWPFGEEAHYGEGIVNAFAEILEVKNSKQVVLRYLQHLSRDWPKGHLLCPCGSRKILRACCRDKLWQLHKKVHPAIAKQAFARLSATPSD